MMRGENLKRVKVEYESEEEIGKLNQSRSTLSYEKLKRVKVEDEEEEEIGKLLMGIMEGYKDSVIPALSELKFVTGSKNSHMGNLAEKSRIRRISATCKRDSISEKFAVLQSMIPSLSPNPKATRETIAFEATKYIMSLQDKKRRLEDMKMKRSRKPALSGCTSQRKPSVTTSVCNDDVAFFAVQFPVRKGLLCRLSEVFQKYRAEVFQVTVFVDDQRVLNMTGTFTILSYGNDIADVVEKIKEEILAL